jgi:hypothetical protein
LHIFDRLVQQFLRFGFLLLITGPDLILSLFLLLTALQCALNLKDGLSL